MKVICGLHAPGLNRRVSELLIKHENKLFISLKVVHQSHTVKHKQQYALIASTLNPTYFA